MWTKKGSKGGQDDPWRERKKRPSRTKKKVVQNRTSFYFPYILGSTKIEYSQHLTRPFCCPGVAAKRRFDLAKVLSNLCGAPRFGFLLVVIVVDGVVNTFSMLKGWCWFCGCNDESIIGSDDHQSTSNGEDSLFEERGLSEREKERGKRGERVR